MSQSNGCLNRRFKTTKMQRRPCSYSDSVQAASSIFARKKYCKRRLEIKPNGGTFIRECTLTKAKKLLKRVRSDASHTSFLCTAFVSTECHYHFYYEMIAGSLR